MHIPDGMLPAQVCAGGYALTGGITWLVLRRIRRTSQPSAELPKTALLTAAFFVGSALPIPVPPMTVHLLLNGLLGAMLGWYAWPAILVGLLLQAIVIGHGGIVTLGVNTVLIGLPALIAAQIYQLRAVSKHWLSERWQIGTAAFCAGAAGLGLSALIFYGLILLTSTTGWNLQLEQQALSVMMLAHLPLVFIEGGFAAMLTLFLRRISPELVNL